MMLKIRKKDNYYQAGYYEKGKWINVEHLGTAEKLVRLVREENQRRTTTPRVPTQQA